MAHINRCLRSINNEDESLCVDVFVRAAGTFGVEEFRRDFEDNPGWKPIGGYGDQIFAEETSAIAAAKVAVSWLNSAM